MANAKLGSGKRFKSLANKIARSGNVDNPDAVAASIGREKYGNKKMQKMAEIGKKRHAKDQHVFNSILLLAVLEADLYASEEE